MGHFRQVPSTTLPCMAEAYVYTTYVLLLVWETCFSFIICCSFRVLSSHYTRYDILQACPDTARNPNLAFRFACCGALIFFYLILFNFSIDFDSNNEVTNTRRFRCLRLSSILYVQIHLYNCTQQMYTLICRHIEA